MTEVETSPEKISLKDKVRKKIDARKTLIVGMLLTNIVIVGLLYGKSGNVPPEVVRGEVERIPRLMDILKGFQILANDSGKLGEYVRKWSREKNITGFAVT